MNISMQLAVVVAAACLCLANSAPDGRLTRKQQRPTRGFKNVEMMTARGFGKRDRAHTRTEHNEGPTRKKFNPKNSLMVAYDFGKRSGNEENFNEVMDADDFLEILGSAPEKENQENGEDNKTIESIPVELFVMEMLNHPEFTRSVVNKFIDVNQDGVLSLEELLRNAA